MLGWGPTSLVVLFVLSVRRLIMGASSRSSCSVGLHTEGWPAEDSESGRPGGRLCSLAAMVVGVLPVGYLPSPGEGKEKISEIRYPCGSEYPRAAVRYTDALGPSQVEPSFAKTLATRYGPPSGVLIFLRRMLFPFPRWFASLRRPLRMTFTYPYTLSSKTSYSISMYARPSSFLIFGASWSAF